jgi:hypothetical protein
MDGGIVVYRGFKTRNENRQRYALDPPVTPQPGVGFFSSYFRDDTGSS